MPSRITRDEMLMQFATIAAQRGTCRKAQVGAILAREGRVVSQGYVGSPPGFPHCTEYGCIGAGGHCMRTIHAEMNAILFAARNGIRTENTELYTTHSPCWVCAKAIVTAGIRRVVYGEGFGEEADQRLVSETFTKADIRYESHFVSPTPTKAN